MEPIFLKIARKEQPSHPVYEDEVVYAFLDIEPYSKGHTLIVPKAPCPDIESIDAPMAAAVLMAAKKITKALRKVYGYDGIILHEVNGEKAQDVMQFHMHVYGTLPPGAGHFYRSLPQDPAEKKAVLASIAQELSTAVADIG